MAFLQSFFPHTDLGTSIVVVYIAPTASNGTGPVWSKLYQTGNRIGANTTDAPGVGLQWAVDDLLTARGMHNIIIPDVPSGDYLLRGGCQTSTESLSWACMLSDTH